MTVNTSTAAISSIVSAQPVEAESKNVGDFFEYNIQQKITIGKKTIITQALLGSDAGLYGAAKLPVSQ